MQRLLTLALAAGLTIGCGAARGVGPFLPRVDSPALRNLGYVPEGQPIVITNGTRFPACDVVAANKELGVTVPGQALTDNRNYHPYSVIQIPVVARCYWDQARTVYAGAGGWIAQLQAQGPPQYWTFRDQNIVLVRNPPQGGILVRADLRARQVKFPSYFFWNGAALLQIVNNRRFPGVVRVDGRDKATIEIGDVYHLANWDISGYAGRARLVQMVYPDQVVNIPLEAVFYVPTQGVYAYQYIVS